MMNACQSGGFAMLLIYMPVSEAQNRAMESRSKRVTDHIDGEGLERAKGGGGDRRATEMECTA